MKAIKITYYISTGLVSLAMLFSTYAYLVFPELERAFHHLGFPDYFRIELAIAKFLAAIALWFSIRLIKEIAYIGLAISFASAIIARVTVGDDIFHVIAAGIILAMLIVSYIANEKLSNIIR